MNYNELNQTEQYLFNIIDKCIIALKNKDRQKVIKVLYTKYVEGKDETV